MTGKRWLTFSDLAAYIGLSLQTLYNWKCSSPEKLPPHVSLPSGNRDIWRFDVNEVDAWMLRNSNGG